MSARSVQVILMNKTSNELQRESFHVTHGIFSSFPPSAVQPFSQVEWVSESNGFLTGTAGSASYHVLFIEKGDDQVFIDVPDVNHLSLSWTNPFVGTNVYRQSVGKRGFEVHRSGGADDHATVVFTMRHTSQDNWRWCNKCQCLAFAGTSSLGPCAAGGVHDHSGSGNYILVHNAQEARGQDNWRWCNKCQCLAFAGNPTLGPCHAGGQHNHEGSGNYVLQNNIAVIAGQDNWHWCNKCQCLYFAGNASLGQCPAGGAHALQGSGNYTLEQN